MNLGNITLEDIINRFKPKSRNKFLTLSATQQKKVIFKLFALNTDLDEDIVKIWYEDQTKNHTKKILMQIELFYQSFIDFTEINVLQKNVLYVGMTDKEYPQFDSIKKYLVDEIPLYIMILKFVFLIKTNENIYGKLEIFNDENASVKANPNLKKLLISYREELLSDIYNSQIIREMYGNDFMIKPLAIHAEIYTMTLAGNIGKNEVIFDNRLELSQNSN